MLNPALFGSRTGSAAALLLSLSLGACSSLGLGQTTKPDAIFDLAAPTAFEAAPRRLASQLLIPLPSTNDALASARIVVRAGGGAIAYMPAASWSDQLPALVQTTLVRAFENSGRVKAVGRPGESLLIDEQVIVDIRAFELDVTAQPTAHVVLGVKLLDDRTGKVRAARVFDVSQPAASDRPKEAVAAINLAAAAAVSDVVSWTAGAL